MDAIDARCPNYNLEYCVRSWGIGVCGCLPWCSATYSWLYYQRHRRWERLEWSDITLH